MTNALVILHLSDAHIGNPMYNLDSLDILDPLLDDIESVIREKNLRPDLLIFSGDIAYGQTPKAALSTQYDRARLWLDRALAKAGSSYENTKVVLVPGNHDVNRNKIDIAHTDWIGKQREEAGAEAIYNMMHANDLLFQRIVERQQEWAVFIKSLPSQPWLFDSNLMLSTGIIELKGQKIGIAGFNSAWASSAQEEQGRLWIGKFQYQQAWQLVKDADFRIAIAHHPFSWLNSAESSFLKQRVQSNFHLFLHGHEHSQWIEDLPNHLKVEAGACYQGARNTNSYSFIRIDFSTKQAEVCLRRYEDSGAGGWVPYAVPGLTDKQGVYQVRNLFSDKTQPVIDAIQQLAKPLEPIVNAQLGFSDLQSLISQLETRFSFRWERMAYNDSPEGAIVYWPVRIRKPTPIHAVQCFAAASLQKLGLRIVLCLDDLGHLDYGRGLFINTIEKWFSRVGGNSSELVECTFSELINGKNEDTWPVVQSWLGVNQYNLDKVLKISKLWPEGNDPNTYPTWFGKSRPRRLLTPAMVWACLHIVSKTNDNLPVITLGGYDERQLWEAWRECFDPSGASQVARVGHLYVPELKQGNALSGERLVHMEKTDLAWNSREDIKESLESDHAEARGSDEWLESSRIANWCFKGCFLLPGFITNDNTSLQVDGQAILSAEQLREADHRKLIPAMVEGIAKWLF